jgi:hypothetical protein
MILTSKLKEISVFIYTLIFLLIFNLYFNLNYNWYGVSLILRVYIFVFSIYLVFIFTSVDLTPLKIDYANKFGKKGNYLLFFEIRILPFLLIYLITVIFTFIDQIRTANWPWDPVLSLLNGRYSNNLIYSWMILIILKLKKKPSITIPLFIGLLLVYGALDKVIYSIIDSGAAISGIKLLKIIIFLFFILAEFIDNIIKRIVFSLIASSLIFISVVSSFTLIFKNSESSFQNRESGLYLLRMGYTFPLGKLTNSALKSKHYDILEKLFTLSNRYNIEIKYSKKEWEQFLFSGPVEKADIVSGYILNKNLSFTYEKIISYAEQQAKDELSDLENAENFIQLSSPYFIGHEKEFLERMKKSNKKFKLWGMHILEENKSIESMPLLISFTTNIDETIADTAYNTLKIITAMDPVIALDKDKKDPDTIEIFKKYYLKYSHNRKVN